jgi:hypothetical protein
MLNANITQIEPSSFSMFIRAINSYNNLFKYQPQLYASPDLVLYKHYIQTNLLSFQTLSLANIIFFYGQINVQDNQIIPVMIHRFKHLAHHQATLNEVGLVSWTAFLMDKLDPLFIAFYKNFILTN